MKSPKDHIKHAIVATDVVLFTIYNNVLHTLLVKVNRPPNYINMWGFPGGLILPKENSKEAIARIILNRTGIDIKQIYLEQLYTFDDMNRDRNGRVVSISYLALADFSVIQSYISNYDIKLVSFNRVGKLAYDHNLLLSVAIERLRSKLEYTNIVGKLLQKEFTLTDLQNTYEIILGRELDKRNFRKKIKDTGIIKKTGNQKRGHAHRPAELYKLTTQDIRVTAIL